MTWMRNRFQSKCGLISVVAAAIFCSVIQNSKTAMRLRFPSPAPGSWNQTTVARSLVFVAMIDAYSVFFLSL
jgi:hypothetical protein